MAEMGPSLENNVDPKNGFCSKTSTFHSLLPPVPLQPATEPLSISHYVLSLLRSHSDIPPESFTAAAFIDAVSGHRVTYAEFIAGSRNLAATLCRSIPELSAGAIAFVLWPSSVHLPVLYFALLSLGVVVSPANPTSSDSEIARLIGLSKPRIAFATRKNASKLPSFPLGTVVTDSPDFHSMMAKPAPDSHVVVRQSDPAAILYSSGTTGLVKGVWLTHRNFVAVIAGSFHNRAEAPEGAPAQPASLVTLPLFHVYGISMMMRAVSLGHTSVITERFDFEGMLRAVEKYRVSFMPASPPLVVALTKLGIVKKYDLSSLLVVGSGGAPLGEETAKRFIARFPGVALSQGYGLTETGGGATRMIGPDEFKHYGSVGRLAENAEAKIVDPVSGKALPPGQQGELWLRGPMTMKGYVGDDKATAAIIDPEGWLKTGDICYFDSDGFLSVVDRLKELIKYKAYQVAPAELEHLLQSNPGIADAAVIPYPDEDAGQIPMAFVVRKPGSSITEAEIMNFIAKQVAPYKKIRRVAFVNAIPKSPTGKILRKELVKHASPTASARL